MSMGPSSMLDKESCMKQSLVSCIVHKAMKKRKRNVPRDAHIQASTL